MKNVEALLISNILCNNTELYKNNAVSRDSKKDILNSKRQQHSDKVTETITC